MAVEEHARLAPSASSRWRRCPGSIRLSEGLPEYSGREAAEGTVYHHFMELCLTHGILPESYLNYTLSQTYHLKQGGKYAEITEKIKFDEEMIEHGNKTYAKWYAWMNDGIESVAWYEGRMDTSPWLGEGQFGTCDISIVKPAINKIIICDHKYGRTAVNPENNSQLTLYALGFWNTFAQQYFPHAEPKDIEVEIVIEQYRAPGGGGHWTTSMANLLVEGFRIREEADATYDVNAPRIPGEVQCKYCPVIKHGKVCPEHNDFITNMFPEIPNDATVNTDFESYLPHPTFDPIDSERRSAIIANEKVIINFIQMLKENAINDYMAGVDIPGFKVIQGRLPDRTVSETDEKNYESTVKRLVGESEAYTKKILSPPEIESRVGKVIYQREVAPFITQGSGKPVLVPLSNKNDGLRSPEGMFDI